MKKKIVTYSSKQHKSKIKNELKETKMLYKSTNKLLLGYKKFNVPLFTFREPPLK